MPSPFEARTATLAEILGDPAGLAAPGYQRGYSWTPVHATQLLDDLLIASDDPDHEATSYFLGAVVLMRQPHDDGGQPTRSDIVDGLQRLMTVTILLAVLRDIAAYEDEDGRTLAAPYVMRTLSAVSSAGPIADDVVLMPNASLAAFFRSYVQEAGASATMPADESLPAPAERVLAVREQLMSTLVAETAARRRRLLHFILERCFCAVISTQSIDRAHTIFSVLNDRGQPLARGDILKAQILGAIAPARQAAVADRWSQMEQRLGGSLEDLLTHVRTAEGRTRSRTIEDLRTLIERAGTADAFVEHTLAPYADILETIQRCGTSRSLVPEKIDRAVRYLDRLQGADWVAPLMVIWRMNGGDPDWLADQCERLERLSYGMRVLGLGSDKRVQRFKAVIDAARQNVFDTSQNPIDLTRDEQKLILFNLRALHQRGQAICKLVLLRLNDEIAGAPQRLDPSGFTVEHILPQKPGRNGAWRTWFADAALRERCTHSLGNLILVTREQNERAKNRDFADKMAIFLDDAGNVPELTRQLADVSAWTPDTVLEREERLMAILCRLWKLPPRRAGHGFRPDDPAGAVPD